MLVLSIDQKMGLGQKFMEALSMTKLLWARGWEGFVIYNKRAQANFRETLSMAKL